MFSLPSIDDMNNRFSKWACYLQYLALQVLFVELFCKYPVKLKICTCDYQKNSQHSNKKCWWDITGRLQMARHSNKEAGRPSGLGKKESWKLEKPCMSCQCSCLGSSAVPVGVSIDLHDSFSLKDAEVKTRASALTQLHTTNITYTPSCTHSHRLLRCQKTNFSERVD